jgi:catechol 2,3-dioxygenase-like lactoylglutathione lyase family enzyme
MFELKRISEEAIPAALEKAVRYRLLGEPMQAESISLDVLEMEPHNEEALATLVLALTDQFERNLSDPVRRAQETAERLPDEYSRSYYRGIIHERQAKAHVRRDDLRAVPVADIDRSKSFYADKLGFHVDHDSEVSDEVRIVQLTPPGSGCSIVIGKGQGLADMKPGSLKGLQLVVNDIRAAHAQLVERGVGASDVMAFAPEGLRPAREDDDLNNVGFIFFDDPDGNSWAVQQITSRG